MAVCDPNIWLNGIIICSIGISFFFSAFILNSSLRIVNEGPGMLSKITNFLSTYGVKNPSYEQGLLPQASSAKVSVLDQSVYSGKPAHLYF